jgi:hypothetical protein
MIVPREPVRTTLRFAASATLRFAPSRVRPLWGEKEGPVSKVIDLRSLKTLCTSRTR